MNDYQSKPTRTRFAPSPTGFLHVGGIRTALFAFLVARQAGGDFILRLEDTDKSREVLGSAEHVIASIKALGLAYDEGPDLPGRYGPYRQSERLDVYRKWAQKLIDSGRAYADPYTADEVQQFREVAKVNKQAFLYRNHRPKNPPAWDGTKPLRFKSDPKAYAYHDVVMGDMNTHPESIDDFIVMKADGYPTYNFAHIVDDAEMAISHVIRGQEFISSMPNYLNLYEALGFNMDPKSIDHSTSYQLPIFAHMPHIMNEQGNKKLGKRDGAKDVLDYIRDGYLPETLVSFIATLGWNDGTEQEVFTINELVEKFSLDRVQRSGARFDEKRLLWMNGHFIRQLNLNDLEKLVDNYWPISAKNTDRDYRLSVLKLAQDRLKTLRDLPQLTEFFFTEPTIDEALISKNKQLKKLSSTDTKALLATTIDTLTPIDTWKADSIQESLNQLLIDTDQKPGVLFSLIRIATTWAPFSPELDKTLELLGKQTTINRLQTAIKAL